MYPINLLWIGEWILHTVEFRAVSISAVINLLGSHISAEGSVMNLLRINLFCCAEMDDESPGAGRFHGMWGEVGHKGSGGW